MYRILGLIEKLILFFNTKILDKTWEIKYKILVIFSSALVTIWYLGMIMQFLDTVVERNYSMFMEYGMVTLTLFGFTLIGGIFEQDKEQPPIKLKLFDSSLNFLVTSIAFFVMYSISYFFTSNADFSATIIIGGAFVILFILGFIGMIVGFVNLLKILIDYRIKLKNKINLDFPN